MKGTCPDRSRLLAYVEGELTGAPASEVERHIADCASCSGAAREMRRVADLLRAAGSHQVAPEAGECPRWESTAAYADGTLPRSERARVEDHLAGCETCRGMLAELWLSPEDEPERAATAGAERRVLKALEREARSAVMSWRDGVATVIRGFTGGVRETGAAVSEALAGPQAVAASVRGAATARLDWKGAGGLELACEVRDARGRPTLVGRLTRDGRPEAAVSVALTAEGLERGPETPDADGRFGPWPLGVGDNAIVLTGPRVKGGRVELTLELRSRA